MKLMPIFVVNVVQSYRIAYKAFYNARLASLIVNNNYRNKEIEVMTRSDDVQRLQKDIEELQARLTFQEDTLQQLDQTIADQDNTIRLLVAQFARWEARLDEIGDTVGSNDLSASERPPHY
jgi:SlyX protein